MSVALIVINGEDIASVVQANALLSKGDWKTGDLVEGCNTWNRGDVHIWWTKGNVLFEDNLDQRWHAETGINVQEVIFPSRHSASSGIPSLTLHYIGVPHLLDSEKPPFGGASGKAPPPNPRLASWFRLLNNKVNESDLEGDFDVTLETTHHGPWLETPSLYIEIGSDESTWNREDAAHILADVIWEGLGLDGSSGHGNWDSEDVNHRAIICIGGGHYAPRHSALALRDGIWLGHILANYALPMEKPENEVTENPDTWPNGAWKQAIGEAIDSTKLAYEGAEICAYLDRKSFKGWQRRAITYFLNNQNIQIGRTGDFVDS